MFCPHCHNRIPDGSNICPLCYSNLSGVKPQATYEEDEYPLDDAPVRASGSQSAKPRTSGKKSAYTKGSRGSKRSADRTPMIIAFGLIIILVVIIVMIVRSMFGAGSDVQGGETPTPGNATPSPTPNFIVFGSTATPNPQQTREPSLEVTPTPTPYVAQEVTYTTLRKGDMGADVVTMQRALAELGYLTGAADGNFGTGTQNAVKAFQKAQGLADDGIAGKLTLEALYKLSSVTPIPEVTVGPGDIMDLPG